MFKVKCFLFFNRNLSVHLCVCRFGIIVLSKCVYYKLKYIVSFNYVAALAYVLLEGEKSGFGCT